MLRNNGIALGLGGLAVAIASTGTAVAVTASTVQIADPTTPSHVAHVDSSGRLSTSIDNSPAVRIAAPNQVLNAFSYINLGLFPMMGPTTATIGITRVAYFNTSRNVSTTNGTFQFQLVKITPGSAGHCWDPDAYAGLAASIDLAAPGAEQVDTYPTPLVFKPTGTQPYCIGVRTNSDASSSNPTSYWNPYAQLTGFLIAGSFSSSTGLALPQGATLDANGNARTVGR